MHEPPDWAPGGFDQPTGGGRTRDVFPLPAVTEDLLLRHQVSKAVRQRLRRRLARQERVNEVIESLNILASSSCELPVSKPSAVQRSAQLAIFRQVCATPDLGSCTVREAVDALLCQDLSYSGEEVGSAVVAYNRSLVSLPSIGPAPPALTEVLDPVGLELLLGFPEHLLLSDSEWGCVC